MFRRSPKRRRLPPVVAIAAILASLPCAGEEGDVQVTGNNTLRIEHYNNHGDEAASSYPNEGVHWFDELSLNLTQRPSPYDTRRAQFFGLYNSSDYRSDFKHLSAERWNLFQEKGDFLVPYRIEFGDYFSQLSNRTQSRSLKGGQLELQPQMDFLGADHSLLFFGGADQPAWRKFRAREDYSAGASWLMASKVLGDVDFTYVMNARDPSAARGNDDLDQHVLSLAWEKKFRFGEQEITVESELAKFRGDHDNVTNQRNGQNEDDNGYFAEINGRTGTPLSYRLRYERYGRDFGPLGAVVPADRQSYEGHATWAFKSGLRFRARRQRFEDAFETNNETDTDVYGINLSGPMFTRWVKDMTGSFDAFARLTQDDNETVDTQTYSGSFNFSKPVTENWSARPSLFYQQVEDHTPGGDIVRTYQVNLSADRRLAFAGFEGSVSPGITWRRVRDTTADTDDVGPSLAFALARGGHSVGANLAYLNQNRRFQNSIDFDTHSASANYSYTTGPHSLGVEFDYRNLDPAHGDRSQDMRFAVFWTVNFGFKVKPSWLLPARRPQPPPARKPVQVDPSLLARLTPGVSVDDATQMLDRAGIRGPAKLLSSLVYETRLFKEIGQRQRLVLVYDKKRVVQKIGLVIDFDDVGDVDTVEQLFGKVRTVLFKTYGRPAAFFEEGDFGLTFPIDVNTNRFLRLYEWMTPSGTLRFGIPRRLDGQIRMEIHHAKRFPGVRNTLWSITEVR